MKLRDEIIGHIDRGFRDVVFYKRDAKGIYGILSAKIHGSSTLTMIPKIPKNIVVTAIDEQHDKVVFPYEDLEVEAVITWNKAQNGWAMKAIE